MSLNICILCAGTCVLMGLWAALLLPETKGVEIEAVFRLFQNHWFWSKIPAVKNASHVNELPYTSKGSTAPNVTGPALLPGAARLSGTPIPAGHTAKTSLQPGNGQTMS